uniref:Uncharacterized protein n=1 Tax=uncultured marine group II/III euryarchaeote KM3_195_B08 TaxID=1457970 RepID=A0A075GSL1_9EURY|nr:hypothetical protein [uncultured marine group II/III euryarchaeote KM3_195_B08]
MPLKFKEPPVNKRMPVVKRTPRPIIRPVKRKVQIRELIRNLDPENRRIFGEIQKIIRENSGLKKVGNKLLITFLRKHPKQLGICRDLLELAKKSESPQRVMMAFGKGLEYLKTIPKAKNVELKIMRLFLQINKDPKLQSLTLEERMNVAYGRLILGTENAEKLRTKRGITYFMRYSPQQLESQMYQIDRTYKPKYTSRDELRLQQTRPTVLVVFNKHDNSGSFYFQSKSFRDLSKKFKVVIYETDNEQGFYNAVRNTHKTHGKITHLMIGGHGTHDKIVFGRKKKGESNEEAEKKTLDLTDIAELRKLSKYLEGVRIILEACSTGGKRTPGKGEKSINRSKHNMRTALKTALKAVKVFAPKKDSMGAKRYEIITDGGEITIDKVVFELMKPIQDNIFNEEINDEIPQKINTDGNIEK